MLRTKLLIIMINYNAFNICQCVLTFNIFALIIDMQNALIINYYLSALLQIDDIVNDIGVISILNVY